MDRTLVNIKIPRQQTSYDITIGRGLLVDSGSWAAAALGNRDSKLLIVSNRKVFGLYGETVRKSLKDVGFKIEVHLIGDGERFKSFRTLQDTLAALSEKGLTRTDAVVALGGGVVGDLAGFAASLHLRGIDLLQIPTTLLSMIDSSVGGKTGINTSFGKNLVGTFHQPKAVLIDVGVLRSLDDRELTAGFCEAIKQAALAGPKLFQLTADILKADRRFDDPTVLDAVARLVAKQVAFKAKIVRGDETEATDNDSPTSRKILNFGHTFGHALEKVTDYKYLRHGEAVGYGIKFAAELSKKLELLDQDEVDSLNDVVRRAGMLPTISNIDPALVLESLKHDKKRVGNSLRWVLLRGIGKPVIVPDTEIPRSAVSSTLKTIFR
ncbi:MAG: 3-dehydroquinate synthase [Acidobacteria bacterium]|nr:MAG: 3-dehydroquinate synthase [Acidobacteriota bacterium]